MGGLEARTEKAINQIATVLDASADIFEASLLLLGQDILVPHAQPLKDFFIGFIDKYTFPNPSVPVNLHVTRSTVIHLIRGDAPHGMVQYKKCKQDALTSHFLERSAG